MNVNDYQIASRETAIYPEVSSGSNAALTYVALGLASEAGEVAGCIKKVLRDGADPYAVRDELGDTAWYLSQLASELGFPLSEILRDNLEKLQSRQARGVLSGNGDNR